MLLAFLTIVLIVADQLSKNAVVANIALHDSIEFIPNFFWINHVHNRGMAFGIFHDAKAANYFFIPLYILAIATCAYLIWKKTDFGKFSALALHLLLAGVCGNLIDRLRYGFVVDFLSIDLKFMLWPSFNIADSCISIGAILLIISSFWQSKNENAISNKPKK